MAEIKLDTICTNEATICFENRMFLNSIGIIQVFTYIGIINFHVINTLILFFFYLKDINTLGIDFINITN